ncbi:ACP S-malonyltransferase [Amycolatopsis keratiniphila]|uniref:[acyl-carrier-protein] S-malonyltransferase n=2 Tax=Amycolatopsis TaxID=1813 RepID=R4T3G1_9PSEU|nr:ACP S-malonyltransferase [Amycolatopsis keratiniphila]ABM47025.1 acyltransferase [Amycolatopsis orientalis]AGM05537.1 (acyl-carrier-protein)S-malonyltransferase-like protein [Amycolatopsis keratiniphila]
MTDERTALVFPGMAPTRSGDVSRFLMINRKARERLATAEDVLGRRLLGPAREDGDVYDEAAQVVFMLTCLSLAEWAEDALGVKPEICAGPSFGQKALTAYTGVLPFEETVRLTAELSRCEMSYFESDYSDVVTHCFVRTPEEGFAEVLAELKDEFHDISGVIDQGFYLLSLREKDLERVKARVRAIGGYSMHTMRPPVHSTFFGGLRRRAEEEVLSGFTLRDPGLPVVADQDGALLDSAAGVRRMLLDTFDRPIDWPSMVATLREQGVTSLCFAGPDNLFHRVDSTVANFEVRTVTPGMALKPRSRA